MGRKSLTRQVQEALDQQLMIGSSKHGDKLAGNELGIYSWNTYRTYLKHLNYFVKWAKQEHGCRDLDECRAYAAEWVGTRLELSPYTQKLEASALRKLYGSDLVLPDTKERNRGEIKRSRGIAERDKNFNPERHPELVAFCRSTGLRRSELEHLRGSQLWQDNDGRYYLQVVGKGGRYREAPVIGDIELVVRLCEQAGDGLVWGRVNSNADIHSYRADYCHAVYEQYARDLEELPHKERYYCKGDRKGVVFDRTAMMAASRALGHNRISVIAGHYLR